MSTDFGFKVVDPHVHQWDPRTTPRLTSGLVKAFGWSPAVLKFLGKTLMPKSSVLFVGPLDNVISAYLPANYAADAARCNVEALVHVEAGWHDESPLGAVGETRWVGSLPFGRDTVELGAIVGNADVRAANFAEVLDTHLAASPKFRGIRMIGAWHESKEVMDFHDGPGLFREQAFLDGFSELVKRDLSFEAWCYSNQLDDVAALASAQPDGRIMLDHLGTPVGILGPFGKTHGQTAGDRAALFGRWKDDIAAVAANSNVHAKLSGLLMPVLGAGYERRESLPQAEEIAELLAPMVEHALAVFGVERCMYASNFPMDRVSASMENILDAFAFLIKPQGEAAMQKIFRDNARTFYKLA